MRNHLLLSLIVLTVATSANATALIYLEWDGFEGQYDRSIGVGEHAVLNVKLDMFNHQGEPPTFGWAQGIDVTISNREDVSPAPHFDIVGLSPDQFVGPGYAYDRSAMPALPFSASEGYRLDMAWDGTGSPSGSVISIILDQIEVVGTSPGENQVYLGYDIVCPGLPCIPHDAELYDGQSQMLTFTGPSSVGEDYWTFVEGSPNIIIGKSYYPAEPLNLTVVPEPVSVGLLGLAALGLARRRVVR